MSAHIGPFALVLFCVIFLYNLLGSNPSTRIGLTEENEDGAETSDVKHF